MSPPPSIDPKLRQQAIDWYVRLASGLATDEERRDCANWRARDPEHERAWERLGSLQRALTAVPGEIAMPALRATQGSRRALLKGVACLTAGVGGGWLAWREAAWQPWTADYRTAVGERRVLTLADGSTLILDTGSAVDVLFDEQTRLLRLQAGELLLVTGHAPGEHRPLVVETRQGRVRALGTRFSVRQLEGRSRVAVLEHAVEARPAGSDRGLRVQAGQQLVFDRQGALERVQARVGSDAWTRGQLVVSDWRLGEVIAELARYRPGELRCAPAVAGIRVSGVFPIDDTDRTLAMLAARFPISVSDLSRYRVVVDTAN